jgi:CO dehydrogenase/acetyl-CoA synthase delta subunit
LGKKKGYAVFVSDFGKIKDKYKDLIDNNIEWGRRTYRRFNSQCNCSHEKSWDS